MSRRPADPIRLLIRKLFRRVQRLQSALHEANEREKFLAEYADYLEWLIRQHGITPSRKADW